MVDMLLDNSNMATMLRCWYIKLFDIRAPGVRDLEDPRLRASTASIHAIAAESCDASPCFFRNTSPHIVPHIMESISFLFNVSLFCCVVHLQSIGTVYMCTFGQTYFHSSDKLVRRL